MPGGSICSSAAIAESRSGPAEKIAGLSKLQLLTQADVQEVLGEQGVTGLRYRDLKTGVIQELAVNGVFVAIGSVPNSDFIRNLVDTNQAGKILVDQRTAKTSRWASSPPRRHQRSLQTEQHLRRDAARAALSAYLYILDIQKYSPCAERGD